MHSPHRLPASLRSSCRGRADKEHRVENYKEIEKISSLTFIHPADEKNFHFKLLIPGDLRALRGSFVE
jgi:hypothetical protein